MRAFARVGSWTPGSWIRMRSAPWRVMTGSATPNWSTRLRMVSSPWRTASSWRRRISVSLITSLRRPAAASSLRRSKRWNSPATVSRSFQACGDASSTAIVAFPSRAMRLEPRDRAVQPAGRDDAVTLLQRREHGLAIALLLLLRADEQEVEDREDRGEE